jgi:hypothetical protein
MKIMEIANPEDQLALWKLVSDKMWEAFAEQSNTFATASAQPPPTNSKQRELGRGKRPPLAQPPMGKSAPKHSAKSTKQAAAPRRTPRLPAPKIPPKPVPKTLANTAVKPEDKSKTAADKLSPLQLKKQQTQQSQLLAQQLRKDLLIPQRMPPKPGSAPSPANFHAPAPVLTPSLATALPANEPYKTQAKPPNTLMAIKGGY